jgi:O-acetyl-ADP-ribose deacetylase (regulator of RNase III)
MPQAIGSSNLYMEGRRLIRYKCFEQPITEEGTEMTKETEEARDERKRKFIDSLKESKCRSLIEPLGDKINSYLEGEITAEDVFKTAHYVSKQSNDVIAMFKKRPDVILAGIAMEDNLYVTGIGEINIKVRRGDLTVLFVDAIINPASPDGAMAAGVAGAIKKAGGDEIEKEALSKAPIEHGSAVVTGAGSLPNLHVIHATTAGGADGESSAELVKGAVLASLGAAEELGAASIAIPGMGTGAGNVSPQESAAAIVEGIRVHEAKSISDIILIDRDEEMVQAFIGALEAYDEETG